MRIYVIIAQNYLALQNFTSQAVLASTVRRSISWILSLILCACDIQTYKHKFPNKSRLIFNISTQRFDNIAIFLLRKHLTWFWCKK